MRTRVGQGAWIVVAGVLAGAGLAQVPPSPLRAAPAFAPDFTPVQPELFGGALAYSNAWADYDGDGDLDVAVSIKGGAIALYRNDRGRFVNVGPALGLTGADGGEYRGLS